MKTLTPVLRESIQHGGLAQKGLGLLHMRKASLLSSIYSNIAEIS